MRFGVRDLLWLTLLSAVCVAWWLDHSRLVQLLPGQALVVRASGTITEFGIPMPNAKVVVHYPNGNVATAVTDANGRFFLTYSGRDGAPPGKRLVVTLDAVDGLRNSSSSTFSRYWKYSDPDSSKLMIDIPSSGSNSLKLALP